MPLENNLSAPYMQDNRIHWSCHAGNSSWISPTPCPTGAELRGSMTPIVESRKVSALFERGAAWRRRMSEVCTCIKTGSHFCKFPHPCRQCYSHHPGVSCYWHAHGKTPVDKRSDGRTFQRSDGSLGCGECCFGDRCDDSTHFDRDSCPYCLGSGSPAERSPQQSQKKGGTE
jgi:hypothetical protein